MNDTGSNQSIWSETMFSCKLLVVSPSGKSTESVQMAQTFLQHTCDLQTLTFFMFILFSWVSELQKFSPSKDGYNYSWLRSNSRSLCNLEAME